MVSKKDRDSALLHGNLLVNYSNASEFTDGCTAILNDIKNINSFPDRFMEKASIKFADIERAYRSLNESEIELLNDLAIHLISSKGTTDENFREKHAKVVGESEIAELEFILHLANLSATQKMLLQVLDNLMKGRSLADSESINFFLKNIQRFQGKSYTVPLVVFNKFTLIQPDISKSSEYSFYEEDAHTTVIFSYQKAIFHSFDIFFQLPLEFHDLVRRCPYCKLYFMVKDLKRKKCYSEECQKEYEKQKKRKQRESEPQFYS